MVALRHADVRTLPMVLREAVMNALAHDVLARISGQGAHGIVLRRDRPSSLLTSQFLLPRRKGDPGKDSYLEKDDESTPTSLATMGMGCQIAADSKDEIRVYVLGSVYVRMLPSPDEISAEPITFRLSRETRQQFNAARKAAVDRAFEANRELLGEEARRDSRWRGIRQEAERTARREMAQRLRIAPDLGQVETREDETTTEQTITNAEEVVPPADLNFAVKPGMARDVPPDSIVDAEPIPQKWRRIDIDHGIFVFDSLEPEENRRLRLDDFRRAMRARIDHAVEQWEQDPDPVLGGLLWRYPAGLPSIRPSQIVNWQSYLDQVRAQNRPGARPDLVPVLEIELLDDPIRPDERTLQVMLINESDQFSSRRQADRETERGLFLTRLLLDLSSTTHRPIRLERLEPSYRYNRYLTYPAMGMNCGIEEQPTEPGRIRLATTWMPQYIQPRIVPYELPGGAQPTFDRLAQDNAGLPVLDALLTAYGTWIDEQERSASAVPPSYALGLDPVRDSNQVERERHRFEEDLAGWRRERLEIGRGIEVLRTAVAAARSGHAYNAPEVMPLTAWRLLNETFARQGQRRGITAWRLFQVAFILTQIPPLVTRIPWWAQHHPELLDPEVERRAALLYFATGGGKSESFFGVLTFNLFLDRLRGKHAGITAMVRYPLRLLTSQQAYRLACILAAAEITRREWAAAGQPIPGRAFEIGFWVGGSNTPNRVDLREPGIRDIPGLEDAGWNEADLLRQAVDYLPYKGRWLRLKDCPFCHGQLRDSTGELVRIQGELVSTLGLRLVPIASGSDRRRRLAHVCVNRECPWNHGSPLPQPLPIHIADSDIYAYAPSVLLGTVDKLALIGQSPLTIRALLGMFGFSAWHDPSTDRLVLPSRELLRHGPTAAGMQGLYPLYATGDRLFFDPYPSLVIQDETHLLDESLGTFAGLFETVFEYGLNRLAPLLGPQLARWPDGTPRRPRVIAATATVTNPRHQIDQIYQRSVELFPRQGPSLYESFYARLARPNSGDPARDAHANPELGTPTQRRYLSLLTNGKAHTGATVAVLSTFHLVISQHLLELITDDQSSRARACDRLIAALPDDPFRTGHAAALAAASHDELATALDLARIALLYVTNKKGGDQVMAAEQDVVHRDHRLAGIELMGVRTELITGSIDAGLIQAVVEAASRRPRPGEAFTDDTVRRSLRHVIATSAISHGVDVDEFNTMFFAGMPSDIAEYIQASSRVGRTHVGMSILLPIPHQRRDRYVVEVHDIFHRFLERMIEPAAVDRWAEQAVRRTLASFVQLKLCGIDQISEIVAATSNHDKAAVRDPSKVSNIGQLSRSNHVTMLREIVDFITNGIGLFHASSPTNKQFYERAIRTVLGDALREMENPRWLDRDLRAFYDETRFLAPPMTSLRDVDEAGRIEGLAAGRGNERLTVNELRDVMKALRRGTSAWGADEAGT